MLFGFIPAQGSTVANDFQAGDIDEKRQHMKLLGKLLFIDFPVFLNILRLKIS
jgi:hypothetical protein